MPQRLLDKQGNLVTVTLNCFAASKCLSFVSLQRQLGKNIKFGQPPPSATPMKKADSGEASLEEDLFLTSPMEIVTQQDIVLSDTENKVRLLQAMTRWLISPRGCWALDRHLDSNWGVCSAGGRWEKLS